MYSHVDWFSPTVTAVVKTGLGQSRDGSINKHSKANPVTAIKSTESNPSMSNTDTMPAVHSADTMQQHYEANSFGAAVEHSHVWNTNLLLSMLIAALILMTLILKRSRAVKAN